MAYLYADNVSPRDRFQRVSIQLDNGTTVVLLKGRAYDLSDTEAARARRFVVLTQVSGATADPVGIAFLPVIGTPVDGQIPVWNSADGAFVLGDAGTGGGGGTANQYTTVDTSQLVKLITLEGPPRQVLAIPIAAVAPTTPTGLGATVSLTSVRLSWTPSSGATSYSVTRDGLQIATATTAAYRDTTVQSGATYSYRVQAIDQYGQRSPTSGPVSAFIDPALNVAPTVAVTAWPPAPSTNGTSILRVNASDANAQTLALTLGVDVGSIQATADPSVWLFTI